MWAGPAWAVKWSNLSITLENTRTAKLQFTWISIPGPLGARASVDLCSLHNDNKSFLLAPVGTSWPIGGVSRLLGGSSWLLGLAVYIFWGVLGVLGTTAKWAWGWGLFKRLPLHSRLPNEHGHGSGSWHGAAFREWGCLQGMGLPPKNWVASREWSCLQSMGINGMGS